MWLLDPFQDIPTLEAAPIEDVAFVVLEYAKRNLHNGSFLPYNMVNSLEVTSHLPGARPFSQAQARAIRSVFYEAVGWLETERLIASDHSNGISSFIITRLGEKIGSPGDMSSYAKRAYLPHDVLRPEIEEVALAPFLAGRYDEAVRAAFTRLESDIRSCANYGHDQYGVPMVRDAFYAGNKKDDSVLLGPLADPDLEFTEREGVAHLFAGALGYIKNPLSHRDLNIDDARLAASRILLANDLMHTLAWHVEKMLARIGT